MSDQHRRDASAGRVIVGVDGSGGAAAALRWAWSEAQLRQLQITAVMAWGYLDQHHADGTRDFDPSYGEEEADAALHAAVENALGPDAATIEHRVVCDVPARALLEAGADAELVVVGAHGLDGFKGLLLGSTSQHVLHHATRPVAVVPDDLATGFAATNWVAVGLDGSPPSIAALRWTVEEAQLRQAALAVVHTWHMPCAGVHPSIGDAYDADVLKRAANETVDGALADVVLPPELPVDRHVVDGSPAAALLHVGNDADLIVVGGRGLGDFVGMVLGSVSQHVARSARCPVLVIPSEAEEAASG